MPVLFAIGAVCLLEAKGPFWLASNLDPDYAYLFNGLLLADGSAPFHVDHPGTTVQLLLALSLRVAHPFASGELLVREVLANPEYHLELCRHALLLVVAAGLLAVGILVRRATGNTGHALLAQAFPLLSPTLWREVLCVRPEPLILALGLVLGGVAVLAAATPSRSLALPALLGALCALGIIGKVTALPWCVLPLFVLRGGRARAVFVVSVMLGAGLLLLPALPRLGEFASLVLGIATKAGRYGRGPAADPSGSVMGLLVILSETPALVLALLLSLTAAFYGRRATAGDRGPFGLLSLGFAATLALQVVLVAVHPREARYLIPALALVGPAVIATLPVLRAATPQFARLAGACTGRVAAGGLAALVALGTLASVATAYASLDASSRALPGVEGFLAERHPATPVLTFYRASTRGFALYFGNAWAGSRYGAILDALYPDAVFFNLWSPRFESFSRPLPTLEALTSHAFLLRGAPLEVLPLLAGRPEFRKLLWRGPLDAVYAVQFPEALALPFGDYLATGLQRPITLAGAAGEPVVRALTEAPVTLRYVASDQTALTGVLLNPTGARQRLSLSLDLRPLEDVTLPATLGPHAFSVRLPQQTGTHQIRLSLLAGQRPGAAPVLLLSSLRLVTGGAPPIGLAPAGPSPAADGR